MPDRSLDSGALPRSPLGTPQRIQLRRTKGWRKPEGAITVARPSKWGNPFKVGRSISHGDELWPWLRLPTDEPDALRGLVRLSILDPQRAVDTYAFWLYQQPALMLALHELQGHDLACWCPLDSPCHADVLLEVANS